MVEFRQIRRAETPSARPAARRPAIREGEFWFWTALFFFATQPFQIAFYSIGADASQSPYMLWFRSALSFGLVIYGYGIRKLVLPFLAQAWPYWLFLASCAVFLVAAVDFHISALALIFSFNNCIPLVILCCRLPAKSLMRALVFLCAASAVLSLFTAVALPGLGVMQGADLDGADNAGNWRGIYVHKNILGHMMGLCWPILLYFGRRYLGLAPWLISLAATALCLIKGHSSSGLVIAAVLTGLYILIIKPTGALRVILLCLFAAASGVVISFRASIVDHILGLLGKSADLSGRTDIWRVMSDLVFERPFTGFGFQYTSSKEMADLILRDFNVVSVHNAYLDNLINLGFPLTLLLLFAGAYPVVLSWLRPAPDLLGDMRGAGTLLALGGAISGFSEAQVAKTSELNLMTLCGIFLVYKVCTIQRGIAIHKKTSWNRKLKLDFEAMRGFKGQPST
jgi:O-antigen ligase